MEYHFNTLIIGGGPSGSACGIGLLKAGVDCCIVDKATFPRVKLCAGLFTGKSQGCLKDLLGPSVYKEAMQTSLMARENTFSLLRGMRTLVDCNLMAAENQPMALKNTDCRILLVNRPELDHFLVRHFVSLGGMLIEGDALKDIDFDNRVATLASGCIIRYERLVAADGTNSRVEHLLVKHDTSFNGKGESALCLEINVDREDLDMTGVNIYFDVVPGSYAWVFSKGEKVCIGLVKLQGQTTDVNKVMREFCERLGLKNADKYPLRGAMLPFGNIMPCPVWKDSVYFIGDAAGLVEPLTGEGIYYALQSGVYASESIASGSTQHYHDDVAYLHRLIHKGQYYQKMIEKKYMMNFFYRHAPRNMHFISHFYLTQIEHACLDSFWKIIWKYKRGESSKVKNKHNGKK